MGHLRIAYMNSELLRAMCMYSNLQLSLLAVKTILIMVVVVVVEFFGAEVIFGREAETLKSKAIITGTHTINIYS